MKTPAVILGFSLLSAIGYSAPAGFRIPAIYQQVSSHEFEAPGIRLVPGAFETPGGVRIAFEGASAEPEAGSAVNATITRIGPSGRQSLSAFSSVRYRNLYPGVDAVFHGGHRAPEFDFELAPGVHPAIVRLRVAGVRRLSLSPEGDLVIGRTRIHKPQVFQQGRQIDAAFVLRGANLIGFALGAYDSTKPLLIDPTITYATYLGGTANDWLRAVATDSAGSVYVAGGTTSSDLPVTAGAPQSAYKGHTTSLASGDAFIAKFSSAGQLVYMTYLGGTGDDYALGIAVDSAGAAYVTGMTNSTDFPVTATAYQRTFGGAGGNSWSRQGDAFVAKLNPAGTALVYCTYLGGSQDETAFAIAVDSTGAAVVTGTTLSGNFPTTSGAVQTVYRGRGNQKIFPRFGTAMFYGGDVFVAKINAAGTQLMYSTFAGGAGDDVALALALDSAGNAYVGGYTLSPDFPTTQGAFQKTNRGVSDVNEFWSFGDGFVFKLNPTGTAFVYSTLIGGSGDDAVSAVKVDAATNLYLCGTTASQDLAVTSGTYQRTYGGPSDIPNSIDQLFGDAFVARLDPSGMPVFITYLGGENDDTGAAIALDGAGNILVAGRTISTRFPVTADAFQKTLAGFGGQAPGENFGDLYLAQLSPDGSRLLYATYYGGSQDELTGGLAADNAGNAWLAGNTVSRNFPVTTGAYRTTLIGYDPSRYMQGDGVLVKFSGFTASTGPRPVIGAIVNGASNTPGTASPGMLFVAYTQNAGPAILSDGTYTSGVANTSQAGVRFLFDNVPAPIVYVSAAQSAGLVPYAVAGKQTVQVVAEYNGVASDPFTLKIADAVPGLFSANYSGAGQGSLLNQDGGVNSATNPAARGSVIVLYGTGEGQTTPAGQDGKVNSSAPFPAPKLPASATVGGSLARVLYAGAAPGLVSGVFQVNVELPAGVGGGNIPVVVQFGGFSTQANLTVAVQ